VETVQPPYHSRWLRFRNWLRSFADGVWRECGDFWTPCRIFHGYLWRCRRLHLPAAEQYQSKGFRKAGSGRTGRPCEVAAESSMTENRGQKTGTCRTVGGVDTLSLPSPVLTLHHHSSQYPVDPRLVARATGFEPIHHFDIHTQRGPLLARTVPSWLRARLFICQR
jgi:hypothetical protein